MGRLENLFLMTITLSLAYQIDAGQSVVSFFSGSVLLAPRSLWITQSIALIGGLDGTDSSAVLVQTMH